MKKRIKKITKERKNFSGVFEGDYLENDFFGNQIRKIVFSNIIDFKGNLIKEKQEFTARIIYKPKGYLGSRKEIKDDTLEINLMRPTKILKK